MGQGGRPRVPDDQRRDTTIGVRVSPAEWSAIDTRARAAGLTPTELLRTAALGQRVRVRAVVPDVNLDTVKSLNRLGGVLAGCIRSRKDGELDVPEELLQGIKRELIALRAELRGEVIS